MGFCICRGAGVGGGGGSFVGLTMCISKAKLAQLWRVRTACPPVSPPSVTRSRLYQIYLLTVIEKELLLNPVDYKACSTHLLKIIVLSLLFFFFFFLFIFLLGYRLGIDECLYSQCEQQGGIWLVRYYPIMSRA